METKFLGLRTTIYNVKDIKEATEWYSKVFQTKPYYNDSYYVGFNIAGYELGLISDENENENEKGASVLTYWGVNDVELEYQRMLEHGAGSYEKPHNVGGEIVVGAVKDPWNNVIGLIYNPEFKA